MKFAGCSRWSFLLAVGLGIVWCGATASGQTFTPKDRSKTGGSTPAGATPSASGSASGSSTGARPTGAAGTAPKGAPSGNSAAGSAGSRPAGATTGAAKGPANSTANAGNRPPVGISPIGPSAAPRAPEWIPLPPDHEKYLDEVLRYWQDSTGKIQRYRCAFRRWEYDGVFVPRDPETGNLPAKSQSQGLLRYASPDKGMFKVEKMAHYTPPAKEGGTPKYLPRKDDPTEHWVCDGKSVFSFDHQNKKLIQTVLPAEMQGRAIVDGPLPFMFGAEVQKIKERFWLRIITPKESKGEYWIEAVPKTRSDSSNFKMVHVIIDERDFLPKAMSIFNLNHDPVKSPSFTTFAFENRETNWSETLEKLKPFHQEFWEPSTPLGYKKIVEQPDQALADERGAAPPKNAAPAKGAPTTKSATNSKSTGVANPPLQAQRPDNKKK